MSTGKEKKQGFKRGRRRGARPSGGSRRDDRLPLSRRVRPRSGAEDCLCPRSMFVNQASVDLNEYGDWSPGVLPQDAFDDLDLDFELPARTWLLGSRDVAPTQDAAAFYVPDERDRDIELSWQDQAATENERD